MHTYGDSYASAFYLLAALILAVSGAGLDKVYDSIAGAFYFFTDVTILVLQLLGKAQKIRSFLLFGGSFAGSVILLIGGFADDLHHAVNHLEYLGAGVRVVSNIIMTFASLCGLIALFPQLKTGLPEKPGILYFVSYFLFFLFALVQLLVRPSWVGGGYILATILWLLASNAIRLKYDESTQGETP